MTTLSDVAKKASVSKMTVSRVINHPQQVTPELRKIVEKAMEQLNYHPNSIASALAHNRTNVVKLVILEDIDTTEPYYMNLLFGIAKGLSKKHYAIQLATDRNVGGGDGYIITGGRATDAEWLDQLDKPFVLFGENRYGYDFIDTDNKLGEQLATQYALNKNYQSIVFIGIDEKEPFEYSREAGYINTLQKHNMIPKIFRIQNHSSLAEKLIIDNWSKFAPNTCFICASDRIAVGVVRAIQRKNGNIPRDFGVIGFDGVFLDQVSNPKLTTVKQNLFKLGELLAGMILQKIKQDGAQQGEVLIEPELIKSESTRK